MTIRQRRFIGIIATIVFLAVYVLVAMAVGGIWAVGRGMAVELPVFILLGIGWLPIAMLLIKWMSKPDPES
jgi:Protein of unknown function (DUF2842)